jgi:hypothetical protein
MEQTLCKLLSQNVINHVTFQNFECSVVQRGILSGDSRVKMSLILVIKIYVCSNSKLQGEKMHKPSLQLLIHCASFVGEVLKALC